MLYNNKKVRHQTFPFTILSGTDGKKLRPNLESGDVIGCILEFDGDLPNQLINFEIKTQGGTVLEDATSVKNWLQRSGGSYLDSIKPVSFPGGNTMQATFYASSNLTADLSGQIIFIILQDCKN